MRLRRFLGSTLSLLALSAAAAVSCGPDAPPLECPEPHPSFDVLIMAPDGPLPPTTWVHVAYGGSSFEDYHADMPGPRQVVFCEPTAADGGALQEPEDSGVDASAAGGAGGEPSLAALGGAAGASGGHGGAGGEGGATPELASALAGLRCQLWTQGPATITVDSGEVYALAEQKLKVSNTVCTVVETIELEPPEDGGMM